MTSISSSRVFSIVVATVLAGCSGGTTLPSSQGESGVLSASPQVHARVVSGFDLSQTKDTLVYIPDNTDVLVFDAKTQQQVATITDGISGPTGIFVQANRDVFVANSDGGNATEYGVGTLNLVKTFESPGTHPWDVAKCPDGIVYVATMDGQVAYYVGGAKPAGFISVSGASNYLAVACGPKSNVYVGYYANGYERVEKFGPQGHGSEALPMQGGYRSPLIVDKNHDVVFGNVDDETIEFWADGGTKPYKTITTFNQPGWVIQYLKFAPGEKQLWAQISEGHGTYAYEIDVKSGNILITLPYVDSGGPGLAVSPADTFK